MLKKLLRLCRAGEAKKNTSEALFKAVPASGNTLSVKLVLRPEQNRHPTIAPLSVRMGAATTLKPAI
jgi:hypothetical protein